MIKPTIGRVVWFWEKGYIEGNLAPQPEAALIVYVHSDACVNLCVLDHNGVPKSRTSVPLYHGEGDRPAWMHCEWMPYQKGQAAKTEQLEQQMASGLAYREPIQNNDRHQP